MLLLFSHSVVSRSLQPHGLQHTRPPWPTLSHSLLKVTSIESVMPSNHLILFCPLLLLPSVFPSIRVSSCESALHIRWPKYWSFSFSISPSNEHTGLISFRMDWLDLLVVQGNLKSLLQHHSSKASILWLSASFIVQLSYPYMTTGKTTVLTVWTFVGKVMFLPFNMLYVVPNVEVFIKSLFLPLPIGGHFLESASLNWPAVADCFLISSISYFTCSLILLSLLLAVIWGCWNSWENVAILSSTTVSEVNICIRA